MQEKGVGRRAETSSAQELWKGIGGLLEPKFYNPDYSLSLHCKVGRLSPSLSETRVLTYTPQPVKQAQFQTIHKPK